MMFGNADVVKIYHDDMDGWLFLQSTEGNWCTLTKIWKDGIEEILEELRCMEYRWIHGDRHWYYPWTEEGERAALQNSVLIYTEDDLDAPLFPDPKAQTNDGRESCYACGANVKQVQGFMYMSVYGVCTECGK